MATRSKKHKKHQIAECVYCGKVARTTEEHVFGRCLFPEEQRPSDPVIIPACKDCNDRKAGDDSYVRDMVNLDISSSGHPIVEKNLSGPIARSMKAGWSQVAKEAVRHGRQEPYHSDGGIYLGQAYCVPVNIKRLNRWCEMVARGLYWAQVGGRIPDNYVFKVNRIKNSHHQAAFDDWKRFGAGGPYRMGREDEGTEQVVSWLFAVDQADRFWGLWLIWFYRRVFLSIESASPDAQRPASAHLPRSVS